MIEVPAALQPVLLALGRAGRPRLVGGCVRDALWGLPPGDIDVEVAGVTFDQLLTVLRPFGSTNVVGRSFGTIKLRLAEQVYDFSLPRRESKTGAGHRGFKIEPDSNLTDREAAARRDFTINAMAWDPVEHRLIDPFAGQADLQARVLRHTSAAFAEDPLRVLRAMQLAARFGLILSPETARLCARIKGTHAELPTERIWGEWWKWATQATQPSAGLRVLAEADWLAHYPEIAALKGTPQDPEWHPEGDVFVHTGHCLDALVTNPEWQGSPPERRATLMFAVLAHDFGKPSTTAQVEREGRLRWISPRHAQAGVEPTRTFLTRVGAPLEFAPRIEPLVREHLVLHDFGEQPPSDSALRRLARRLVPATIDDLCQVMIADRRGRPPRDDAAGVAAIRQFQAQAQALAVARRPPPPLLLGRHLIARGMTPGPAFKPLLDRAYEAQLDGDYNDEAGALVWLDSHLRPAEG